MYVYIHLYYDTSERWDLFTIHLCWQATDQESLDNITYVIVGGNTLDNAFSLHPRTGVLSLSRGLNYEETPDRKG